ncbi:MAG: hypothetical protein JRJ87_07010 [Deltaproteobacteria bacterium]|nr:hypothetical protein [Deltaproteobacteria bacterium]
MYRYSLSEETLYSCISTYCWLTLRFSAVFATGRFSGYRRGGPGA